MNHARLPIQKFTKIARVIFIGVLLALFSRTEMVSAQDAFERGSKAYETGEFDRAAAIFRQGAEQNISAGLLQNLGNAEWKSGHAGPAILAWERAEWLNPYATNARVDLRFARKATLLDAPDLSWYEICSAWLPVNAWAWLACATFWLAVAMILLPWVFRWRRTGGHQALAAAGFAVFLLTLPAMWGVHTRSKMGIVIAPDTILRLTPTANAQAVSRLPDGETARLERARGQYLYIRTSSAEGWVDRSQFALIAQNSPTFK
jgi:tetratricopeptide (TPR) repeat protein